uniref:Uncharacterized protein n=1 Tax=Rhipicephalus appendiculatus TaxID=34631 RepID=A0A131YGM3_RHIAP
MLLCALFTSLLGSACMNKFEPFCNINAAKTIVFGCSRLTLQCFKTSKLDTDKTTVNIYTVCVCVLCFLSASLFLFFLNIIYICCRVYTILPVLHTTRKE